MPLSCTRHPPCPPLQNPSPLSPPPPHFFVRLPSSYGMAALASSFSSGTAPRAPLTTSWNVPGTGPRLSFSPLLPHGHVFSGGGGLRVRGGGVGAAARSAGSLSSSASTAEAVKTPVEKFRKDYRAPGHWTRQVRGEGGETIASRENVMA